MAARALTISRMTGFSRGEMHAAIRAQSLLFIECAEEDGRRLRLTRITTARSGRTFVRGYLLPNNAPFRGWFEDSQPGILHLAS